MIKAHQVKTSASPGSDFKEVYPPARKLYNRIKAQTKRQPYVRSKYFRNDKVFIELFWVHLNQKSQKERRKRLKFYACAIELLRETRLEPSTKPSLKRNAELFHRFAGVTQKNELFYVQIKENTRTKRRILCLFSPRNKKGLPQV